MITTVMYTDHSKTFHRFNWNIVQIKLTKIGMTGHLLRRLSLHINNILSSGRE